MSRILISYRRDDSLDRASSLYQSFVARWGQERVVMDTGPVAPASAEKIERVLDDCALVVVVIGKSWTSLAGLGGRSGTLHAADEIPCIEAAAALKRGMRVIPVLVGGARLPEAGELPEDLCGLGQCSAIDLRDSAFDRDVAILMDIIDRLLAEPAEPAAQPAVSSAPTEPLAKPAAAQPGARGKRLLRWAVPAGVVVIAAVIWAMMRSPAVGPDKPAAPAAMSAPATTPGVAETQRNPLEVFRDCSDCPELVVVAAGKFMMGSPATEAGRFDNEEPQHPVTLGRSFAVGKFPVTRREYAAFARDINLKAGQCWQKDLAKGETIQSAAITWLKPGFDQDDNHPVVCVSWNDAKAFAQWLSKKTSRDYRLLTEAEWEYVVRAGSTTAQPWGDNPDQACLYANVRDQTMANAATAPQSKKSFPTHHCNDGSAYTSPVGRYRANAFGVHDTIGNVWEWVEDCWNDTYQGAPADGSAWTAGQCDRRVLRGGGWDVIPRDTRSANRDSETSGARINYVGFRIARPL